MTKPPMGGGMNQATYECLGVRSKSSYLWGEGRTKPPTSALVKDQSLPTYKVTNEPSHQGDERSKRSSKDH